MLVKEFSPFSYRNIMANPVTTTNNSSKVPDIDPRKAVINISAKPVLDGDNKQSQETIEANKAEARKDGENLAAVSEDLAIQPVLDQKRTGGEASKPYWYVR